MRRAFVAVGMAIYLAALSLPAAEGWFKDSAIGQAAVTAGRWSLPPECAGIKFKNTIYGTPADDTIIGTQFNDLIFALAGNDHIEGYNGQDCIVGGDGNDLISGGNARDYLFGGPGDDTISGGNGGDTIRGGDGADFCEGDNGPDIAECETIEATGDGVRSPGANASATPADTTPRPRGTRAGTSGSPGTSSANGRIPAPSRTPAPSPSPEPPLLPSTLPTPDTFHHTRGNESGVPATDHRDQWVIPGGYYKP